MRRLLPLLLLLFVSTAHSQDLWLGGDISMLNRIENGGGTFQDYGQTRDFMEIFTAHGANCCRVRLFVDPNGQNQVINDLPYTLALAKRIKASGCRLLLDLHYSDTWADPSRQTKPVAWQHLDFEALVTQVKTYTSDVLSAFEAQGTPPDMVQVGNEILPGFLWPEGHVGGSGDQAQSWRRFVTLLNAGLETVREHSTSQHPIQTMLHISSGGHWGQTNWFFGNLQKHDVDFDVIGLSYYPWWHGPLQNLRTNLRHTANTYGKPIVIVETAYPWQTNPWWKKQPNLDWPTNPAGQRAFLTAVIDAVAGTPKNLGLGVLYWYPESIPVTGLEVWNGGATALFDTQGHALPAIRVLNRTSTDP